MSIKINVSSTLRRFTNNQKVIRVNGDTVGECLKHLGEQFPDFEKRYFDKRGDLSKTILIYVNGKSTYPERLAKPVKDGDELHIMFLMGGG